MKKRVLVAGGAGFIGSHLVDLLLKQENDVTVIDSLVTGRALNLKQAKGAKFIERNICDRQICDPGQFNEKFDEIYNLASPASPVDFSRMPVFIMETASVGHRHLLDLAREHRAKILFASTSEVYGDPLVHPQQEGYFGNVNPIGPRSCYDEAKRFGEALTYSFHRQYAVDVRVARIFNTYGSRMRPDDGRIIPNFFIQALQGQAVTVYGEGRQTRSFCYVSDLAEGLYRLMQSSENMPVNIGNPIERTVLDIAHAINKITGNTAPIKHLPFPENDPKQRCPDISRAQRMLGWEPKVTLEAGLAICHDYFRTELKVAGGKITAPTMV